MPAALPALAFIGGVAAGVLTGLPPGAALTAALVSGALALWSWRAGPPRAWMTLALAGFSACGAAAGALESRRALTRPLLAFHHDYMAQRHQWPTIVEGRLREDAARTDLGVSLVLDVERVGTPCGWLPAAGGVRLSVAGELALERRDEWRAGRTLRATTSLRVPTGYRNPGAPNDELALARRGLSLVGSVKSAALVEVVAHGHPAAEAAAAVRAATRRTMGSLLPDQPVPAAIVTAILIGDRAGLPPEIRRRLQEAGTYHVIAISGGNIAILAGVSFFLLAALRVPPRASALALAGLLCAYGYVAGGGPSVARATIAAVIYLIARAIDHRTPAVNALAVVALIAVVREPLEVFDPGLWLSYGATLAILAAAERLMRHPPARSPRLIARAVAAALAIFAGTVAAEVALFPVGAYVFQRVTLAGLVLNFAAIPLMSVTQMAGLAAVACHPWLPPLAGVSARIAGLAAAGLVRSADLLSLAPWLTWRVPSPAWGFLAAYYAALAGCLWAPALSARRRHQVRAAAAGAAVLAGLVIASPFHVPGTARVPRPSADQLRVTFLDVGQGDAALIEFPGGHTLLVDAAGLPGVSSFDLGDRVIAPALLALGVRRLDALAITHGDPDHVGGALAIARAFRPRELWEGVPVPPHRELRALGEHVAARGGVLRLVRPDDRLTVGGVELRVLHPPEPDWERQRVRNDDSIAFELRYGEVSIVLPGDIGAGIERTLAPRLAPAPLRILKAAHHGSATSTSQEWLEALAPAAVVFSCGRQNRYGHPSPQVLARVRSAGAEIFRTDEDGAIAVTTDGRQAFIKREGGRGATFIPRTSGGPPNAVTRR